MPLPSDQFSPTLAILYVTTLGSSLFTAAKGQGLLHDRLFTELDLQPFHVAALLCVLLVRRHPPLVLCRRQPLTHDLFALIAVHLWVTRRCGSHVRRVEGSVRGARKYLA